MEFLIKQSGHNSVEVDIGFVPQMELEASHPSMKAVDGDVDLRDIPLAVSNLFTLKDFWTNEFRNIKNLENFVHAHVLSQ